MGKLKAADQAILKIEIGVQRLWLYLKIMGTIEKDANLIVQKIGQISRQLYLCHYNYYHEYSNEYRQRLIMCQTELDEILRSSNPSKTILIIFGHFFMDNQYGFQISQFGLRKSYF